MAPRCCAALKEHGAERFLSAAKILSVALPMPQGEEVRDQLLLLSLRPIYVFTLMEDVIEEFLEIELPKGVELP